MKSIVMKIPCTTLEERQPFIKAGRKMSKIVFVEDLRALLENKDKNDAQVDIDILSVELEGWKERLCNEERVDKRELLESNLMDFHGALGKQELIKELLALIDTPGEGTNIKPKNNDKHVIKFNTVREIDLNDDRSLDLIRLELKNMFQGEKMVDCAKYLIKIDDIFRKRGLEIE